MPSSDRSSSPAAPGSSTLLLLRIFARCDDFGGPGLQPAARLCPAFGCGSPALWGRPSACGGSGRQPYSNLNALIGSIVIARLAGIQHAPIATTNKTSATITIT